MSYSEWVKGRETGYIDRAKLLNEMEHECENCEFRDSDGYECEECDYAHAMLYVKAQKAIKIQSLNQWHKYPDDMPPFDGDYLCYHKEFCNVYEFFHEKWFSESGEEVKQIDKDGLYWQDLPAYPKAIKG